MDNTDDEFYDATSELFSNSSSNPSPNSNNVSDRLPSIPNGVEVTAVVKSMTGPADRATVLRKTETPSTALPILPTSSRKTQAASTDDTSIAIQRWANSQANSDQQELKPRKTLSIPLAAVTADLTTPEKPMERSSPSGTRRSIIQSSIAFPASLAAVFGVTSPSAEKRDGKHSLPSEEGTKNDTPTVSTEHKEQPHEIPSITTKNQTPPGTTLLSETKRTPSIILQPHLPTDDLTEIMVKNLDTGDAIPANKLNEEYRTRMGGINPLAYQIYKRSAQASPAIPNGDTGFESDGSIKVMDEEVIKKTGGRKSKSFFKSMRKKLLSGETNVKHGSDTDESYEDDTGNHANSTGQYIRVHVKRKPRKQFDRLVLVQELMSDPTATQQLNTITSTTVRSFTQMKQQQTTFLAAAAAAQNATSGPASAGTGPIWTMKFNRDGRYLAVGGHDAVLRVWAIVSESNPESEAKPAKLSPSTSPDLNNEKMEAETDFDKLNSTFRGRTLPPIFKKEPCRLYEGHKSDILDLSWSKNDFLLSSSMDKTVRLWHITRKDCLCCFQHADFVTSIAFHPKDDRFFLSGCLDCRLRLWNIPDKKVQFWNEMPESALITAVGFSCDGKTAIAGSYLGNCVFFETNGLRYNTQIHVRSTRGKNSKGEKITGIEAMPGQVPSEEKILITSNDSRVRIYQLRDKSLFCKYKGLSNGSSQIKAMFSDDAAFIISGSEDQHVYIWNVSADNLESLKLASLPPGSLAPSIIDSDGTTGPDKRPDDDPSVLTSLLQSLTQTRRDRNTSYETFQAHSSIATCAVFAPRNTAALLEMSGYRGTTASPNVSSQESLRDSETEKRDQLTVPSMVESRSRSSSINSSAVTTGFETMDMRRRSKSTGGASLDKRRVSSVSNNSQHLLSSSDGRIIVTSDYLGCIRVFENERLKRGYYAVAAVKATEEEGVSQKQRLSAPPSPKLQPTSSSPRNDSIEVRVGILTSNAAKVNYSVPLKPSRSSSNEDLASSDSIGEA